MKRILAVFAACATLSTSIFAQNAKKQKTQAADADYLLIAMAQEMSRAKTLQFASLEAPYYIEYSVDDQDGFTVSASLGGLISSRHTRLRVPRLQVRVGTYNLDNTNFILTDYFAGSGPSPTAPLDNSLLPLRTYFWLATDSAYKAAFEVFARKRAAMANFVAAEQFDDFAKLSSAPVKMLLPVAKKTYDETAWRNSIRNASTVFSAYPKILNSNVNLELGQSTFYLASSEGAAVRVPDNLSYVTIRAEAQAADGSVIHDAALFQSLDADRLPAESELRRAGTKLAEDLTALAAAPSGESYSGPVLFEARAAAQLFAELLGRNLAFTRKPVTMPNQSLPILESELDGRVGARILPEWMEVVDDPTKTDWNGKPLIGGYKVDIEGIVPAPVKVVDRGNLINVLLTRQPVRGYAQSNGRARLLGSFGAKTASISNLIVTPSTTVSPEELKKRLIEMVQKRNKPYGLLVRKMDFPSAASDDELRRISTSTAESGSARAISSPLYVYKVYPDGREELVRGLRFKGMNVRSLRDIVAASNETCVFDFLNSPAPFAGIGRSNFVAAAAVVAPAVLFDDLELDRPKESKPVAPIVPPPTLVAAN